jgi:hypothetical protein
VALLAADERLLAADDRLLAAEERLLDVVVVAFALVWRLARDRRLVASGGFSE